MKIRSGFVSNSSSSSFLIYGTCIEPSAARKIAKELKLFGDDEDYGNIDVYEISNHLEKKMSELGISLYFTTYGEYSIYIGNSWDEVKDNETGAEFKERTQKDLVKLFGDYCIKFGTFSEAWYDG